MGHTSDNKLQNTYQRTLRKLDLSIFKMKSIAVILAVIMVVSLLPRSEAFTAGAGNIGAGDWPGKREMKSQVAADRLHNMCEAAKFVCGFPHKRDLKKHTKN